MSIQGICVCILLTVCVQFWYWGPMSEANKTMASSPVFKLPNSYPFIHKEYSWADFVAQRMTNLHDETVRDCSETVSRI